MNERNEKTAKIEDEALAKRAKELFDQSVQGLDAETQSRLNRGRHEALSNAAAGAGHGQWLRWAPATGVAAAAVVAVVVLNGRPPADELTPPATASDFEILLNEDSFEMLEELEFYSWIDLEAELETNGNVG
jgi:hypothetical protein